MVDVEQPSSNGARRTAERRWAILQDVQRSQRVTVAELSRRHRVSQVSIRRDLDYLRDMGLLRRVHGAAEARPGAGRSLVIDVRLMQGVEAKRAVGRAAAALIQPGDTVMFGPGTTTLEIVRHIPHTLLEEGGLTVICRSLLIASELCARQGTRLVLLGGVYMRESDTFVGEEDESAFRGIHANTLFVSAEGVTLEHGLSTTDVLEAPVLQRMARCADRLVVAVDSSKIGLGKFRVTTPIDAVDVLVTDAAAPADFVEGLHDRGIRVILAPLPEAPAPVASPLEPPSCSSRSLDEQGGLPTLHGG